MSQKIMGTKGCHFEGDGNGGFHVSKEFITAVVFLAMLLGAIIPTVVAFTNMNNKVDTLNAYFEKAGPEHTAIINGINSRIDVIEKEDVRRDVQRDQMANDITEMKGDIKDIKSELINQRLVVIKRNVSI